MYCKAKIVLQGVAGLYCSLGENCIARVAVYCNREGWQQGAVYCNTLHCIVAGSAAGGKVVSQYNLEYCGRRQGCLCHKAGSRVATRRWAEALEARLGTPGAQVGAGAWALGRAGGRRGWANGVRKRARRRTRQAGTARAREAAGVRRR